MARLIVLTNAPLAVATECLKQHSDLRAAVLAPNPRAGDALGCHSLNFENLAAAACRRRAADAWTARRALREAVREVLAVAQPQRVALAMEGSLRRLLRAGADLDRLAETGTPRVRNLARVGLRYRERLPEGAVDPAELLYEAAQCVPPKARLVYGYGRLDLAERHFVNQVCSEGSVLILPGGEHPLLVDNAALAAEFESHGWTVERADRTPDRLGERLAARLLREATPVEPGELAEQAYPDAEAEVRGVLGQVKELLTRGVGAHQVVVVARHEDRYAPLMDAVAHEYGLPLWRQQQIPLSETRLGAWLRLAFEVVLRDWPFEATVRLLGQRLTGFDDELLARALAERTRGRAAWQAIAAGRPLVEALAACPGEAPVADWVAWLRELLAAAELPRRLAPWAPELLAYAELTRGLDGLEARQADRRLSGEGFCAEALELLETATVDADPRRHGVAFRSPLAVFGASYDYVYVLGAAEGLLPAALGDEPYLDAHERALLTAAGCPQESAAEAALRERLSFYLLLQTAARRLVLARPEVVDRRAALPSPLIAELGAPRETSGSRCASIDERRRAVIGQDDPIDRRAAAALEVELRRESASPADEYDGVVGQEVERRTFSLSELTVLGQCPFRWFASRVLSLSEVEEAAAEPDAPDRGNLLHRTLELTLRAALQLGCVNDREALVALLPAALDAAAGRAPEPTTPEASALAAALAAREEPGRTTDWVGLPHWPLLRADYLTTLTRAVRGADFIDQGAEPIAFELRAAGGWNGLALRGRIDRVDRLADGRKLVVDYKSRSGRSAPPGIQDQAGKLKTDLQLDVYRTLCPREAGEPVEARYYNLGSGERASESREDPTPRLAQFADEVRERLASGTFPVLPDLDLKACDYCDLDLVCRAGLRLARKSR